MGEYLALQEDVREQRDRADALAAGITELLARWDSRTDKGYIGWMSDLEEQIELLRELTSA